MSRAPVGVHLQGGLKLRNGIIKLAERQMNGSLVVMHRCTRRIERDRSFLYLHRLGQVPLPRVGDTHAGARTDQLRHQFERPGERLLGPRQIVESQKDHAERAVGRAELRIECDCKLRLSKALGEVPFRNTDI